MSNLNSNNQIEEIRLTSLADLLEGRNYYEHEHEHEEHEDNFASSDSIPNRNIKFVSTKVIDSPTATIDVNYYGFSQEAEEAFEYAVTIWEGWIKSDVVIEVDAYWQDLSGYGSGILGAAAPYSFTRNFEGANQEDTWYAMPLANHLAGEDLNGDRSEIEAWFNSDFSNWYFGTDGNTPSSKYDFATVVLHELGHGLGFTDYIDYSNGTGSHGNTIFESFIVNGDNEKLSDFPNNSKELGDELTSDDLFFNGANAIEANGGEKVKLYAPNTWEYGSSIAHLDEKTYPKGDAAGSLMTPYFTGGEVLHDPGAITLGILEDLGWDINEVDKPPVIDDEDEPPTPPNPPVVETPSTPASIITFEESEITSYAGQDVNSTFTISDDKQEIDIQGNGWKKLSLDYEITDKTILEFEFQSNIKGEIQGIGFDTDDNFGSGDDKKLLFQLEGSQDVGVTDFKDDVTGKGWQTYKIEVGKEFTGEVNYLTFVNDHDNGDKNAHSQFRNLRLYEEGQEVQPVETPSTPPVVETPSTPPVVETPSTPPVVETPSTPASIITFEESEITSYAGQDVNSTFTISDDKQEIDIKANGWKKLSLDYEITDKTILEFEFQSNIKGEIQGIGFDTDDKFGSGDDKKLLFQLEGSQDVGVTDFKDDVTGKGWQTYKIEVGKEFTGNINYLTFVNDHDNGDKNAHSQYRNLRLYEEGQEVQPVETPSTPPVVETPSTPASIITFEESEITSYAGQDVNSTFTISDDKQEIDIQGNGWKKLDLNYEITDKTILEFEFQSNIKGEIQGIGFDTDDKFGSGDDKKLLFQLEGSQDIGVTDFKDDVTGKGWQTYKIEVGKEFTGDVNYLTFVNDHDNGEKNAHSQFRNIKIYEGDRNKFSQTQEQEVALTVQDSTNNYTLFSYGGTSQDKGTYTISDDKAEVEIKGNAWKKFDINNYNVTQNTVLKFEFKSTVEGEIQGIGFDNDEIIGSGDAKHLFKVSGTQNWGIELDDDYTLGSWKSYEVKVGDNFTGEFDYLTLANDHDISNSTAQSQFRNISLYEM